MINDFVVKLTQAQTNLIFSALQTHIQSQQNAANELIRYIDSEFLKANPQLIKENIDLPGESVKVAD